MLLKFLLILFMVFMNSCTEPQDRRVPSAGGTSIEDPLTGLDPEPIVDTPTEDPGVDPVSGSGFPASGGLKFKRQKVLEQDIMSALKLEKSEVCTELGNLNCFSQVHRLSLGGVSPYEKNIFVMEEPFLEISPIVVDRIVLRACNKRAELDFSKVGTPHIFSGVKIEDTSTMEQSVQNLYFNALQRDASKEESAALLKLAGEIQSVASVSEPDFEWARLACYSVLTSTNFLFY